MDPSRFNLTNEELSQRRRWIDNTRDQVDTVHEALKGAIAAPPPPPGGSSRGSGGTEMTERIREGNSRFVGSEVETQALMMR